MNFTNLSMGAIRYVWQFGDGKTSTDINPTNLYNTHGNYYAALIAITDKGCSDTLYKTVIIPEYRKGLFVPNAFTPDYGQDKVRVFKPVGAEISEYRIQVYNTMGALVWESNSLDDGWDGINKYTGIACPQGVYIWVIYARFTDGDIWPGQKDNSGKFYGTNARPGNVTLIR
jgi:PKD repeat protein